MVFPQWRFAAAIAILGMICFAGTVAMVWPRQQDAKQREAGGAKTAAKAPAKPDRDKALRSNTLGVAYLNQQRPGDAQRYFEQALAADPTFAVGRLNLGIALMAQQKLEAARAALEAAAKRLPQEPYAW